MDSNGCTRGVRARGHRVRVLRKRIAGLEVNLKVDFVVVGGEELKVGLLALEGVEGPGRGETRGGEARDGLAVVEPPRATIAPSRRGCAS